MAIQGCVAEAEVLRLLDSRHLRYLSEAEMRLLAASEFGYTVEQMTAGFGRSEATMRRHLAHLKQQIFDFIELEENTPLLNHWTRRHFPCCTKNAQEMIENCQIFGIQSTQSYSIPGYPRRQT